MSLQFGYRAARRLLRIKIAEILVLDLSSVPRGLPEKSDFDFQFLSAADLRTAATDAANDLDANVVGRLERGHSFCYAAFERKTLANYSWYALGRVEPEHSLHVGLDLPEDTVYMYKAFTLPAFRGQRLHQATLHRAMRHFVDMGLRRLITLVEYGNTASLSSHLRMGCQRVGRVYLVARCPIYWHCDSTQTGNLRLGYARNV